MSRHITLALGGGGARGVSHLGVIEEVLRAGWQIDRIIGISIGSLAGAIYAFDPDIERVQHRVTSFLKSPEFARRQRDLFSTRPAANGPAAGGLFAWYQNVMDYLQAHQTLSRAVMRKALLPGAFLKELATDLLPDADIADAVVPLEIAALDLLSGQSVVLKQGSVRTAVQASAALPGIFPPVELDGRLLADLGVLASLPTRLARETQGRTVFAVDVGGRLKSQPDYATGLDVLMRVMEIGETRFREDLRKEADLVIAPDVGDVAWSDFTEVDELIERGRSAARVALRDYQPARNLLESMWQTFSIRRTPTPVETGSN